MEEKFKLQLERKNKKIEKLEAQIEKLKKKNSDLDVKYHKVKLEFAEYKKKLSEGEIKVDKIEKKTKSLWALLCDDYPETADAINKMQKHFSWTYLNHKSAAELIRTCLEGKPRSKIPPEFANEKQLLTYFNFLLYLPLNTWGKDIFGGAPVSLQAALKRRPQVKAAIKENANVKAHWKRYQNESL